MKDVAVVPVKSLPEAKRRLSNYLTVEERRKLVLAMLDDVLRALDRSHVFSEILIVSPDDSLENQVSRNHVFFLKQRSVGLNAAIRQASRELIRGNASSMTTVLADLPLAGAKDFEELASISHERPRVILVPSLKGGTNVMARHPPELIANSYGRWSYAKHLRAGQKKGVPVYSVSNSRLSFDLDTIQDLKALRQLDPSDKTQAARFARELRVLSPTSKATQSGQSTR